MENQNIRNKNTKFIVLWNNRNIRRKLPVDVVLAYNYFLNKMSKEERKDFLLILKTAPVDNNGTDLVEVVKNNCPTRDVYLYRQIR